MRPFPQVAPIPGAHLRPPWHVRGALGWLFVALCSCGPSVEDSVRKLAGTPEQVEEGRQELLLAKDRAVGPLLELLSDPELSGGRVRLAEVLVGLSTRVDDPRVDPALRHLLRSDPDSLLRAHIAHHFGLYHLTDTVDDLLQALGDDSGVVRFQALRALGRMEADMGPAARESLRLRARELATDRHVGSRREAMIRTEAFVDGWIQDAHRLALAARAAEAESLFARALDYAPASKRANYRFARFCLENGQRQRGLDILRQHAMMLRVPRFDKEPVVDGRLDEDVWTTAACADSFFQHSMEHYAAVPSRVPTRVCLGYTSQDLYVGFVGGDAHPDSLVVKARYHDEDVWYEDALELFLDPGFDHQDYLHIGVTSQGVVADGAMGMGGLAWNAEATAAAHVGPDRWSLEYRVAFDEPEIPPPMPGAWWGADFVRVYRGSEYSQWVRTYHGGHRPDEFGLLVFE